MQKSQSRHIRDNPKVACTAAGRVRKETRVGVHQDNPVVARKFNLRVRQANRCF